MRCAQIRNTTHGGDFLFLKCALGPAAFGLLLSLTSPAAATYSLIAVDTESGEMGGAVISCIGTDLSLSQVVRLGEDHIVAAQGYFFEEGRDELLSQLESNATPSQAIAAALAPNIDPVASMSGPSYRQYAALNLSGVSAQHSGADLLDFAGDRSGTVGTVAYALQGNILTGSEVLDELEGEFAAREGTIASRIFAAISALADAGGGDSRCSPRSGDAGYFVLREPGSPLLEIEIVEPQQEVARALAGRIEASGATEAEPTPPTSDSTGSSAKSAEGCACTLTPGDQGSVFPLGVLGALGLLFRRRPRRSGS